MTDWSACVEFDATLTDEQGATLAERLADRTGTVTRDEGRGRVAVAFHVAAGTLRQATDEALRAAREVVGVVGVAGGPVAVQVTTWADLQAELDRPRVPELVGLAEIAAMLGAMSKQRVRELAERDDFPPPVARLSGGAVYAKAAIEAFDARWPETPGRPGPRHTQISAELSYITKDRSDEPQQALRMVYNARRSHDLSRDPQTPAGLSLARAISSVREQYPDFEPRYDASFFEPVPTDIDDE
jgi:hypothetical protein